MAVWSCSEQPSKPTEEDHTLDETPSSAMEAPGGSRSSGRTAPFPNSALVARARETMGSSFRSKCGPYIWISQREPGQLLGQCGDLVDQLDDSYERSLGVTLVDPPRGAILVFTDREAYRQFAVSSGGPAFGYSGFSRPSRSLVVLAAGDKGLAATTHVLVHELTHLLHRRAFSPELTRRAPWLSEGLADAIADSYDPTGFTQIEGTVGAEIAAGRLQGALGAGLAGTALDVLLKSRPDFDRGHASFDYEWSSLLVRFLLTDPTFAPRFRDYLGRLAGGESYSTEDFLATLEVDADALENYLRQFLGAC